MRRNQEKGIALITALLLLFLISAIVVGMSWMVMTDQRLGGNNKDREAAFYGAEAGMEKMTADVGGTFSTRGAVTAADIVTITGAPPTIPGIQFLNALGQSTYQITPAVPISQNATILPPSPYSGMQALITPLTLTVAAQTNTGSEVKLQRSVQVVAIPVFQFGIYSDSDLDFFNGPPFDFGGRAHTNGNIWLASNSGPLYMADKVTAVGQVIRTNLENGYPGGGGTIGAGGAYSGTVTIATTPNPATLPAGPSYSNAQWSPLQLNEGSVSGASAYGAVSSTPNTANWSAAKARYNGQLQNGVPILSLTATALGGITTPISLIRRPTVGELASNPAEFSEQYFSEASLRILLDDYGPSGTCTDSPMMGLDTVTPTAPVDLATLAFGGTSGIAAPGWYAGTGYPSLPLSQAASAANYTTYTSASPRDGYWIAPNKPLITGCIKIDYQNAANTWTDVTQEILKLGFTGPNINPTTTGSANTLQILPNTGTTIGSSWPCGGPTYPLDPNAIIRLARVRDNPTVAYSGLRNACTSTASPYDFWPMVLYDTRDGISRDTALGNNANDAASAHPLITAQGVMDYVELDANNLARWFTGAIGTSGLNANSAGGYTVYFSDRRGNQVDPVTGLKTGSFGFNDVVNASDAPNGCPNGSMDTGEDMEGDGVLRVYGGSPLLSPPLSGGYAPMAIHNLLSGSPALSNNPNCAATTYPSPNYVYTHNQEARENPPVFFRRALKIVDGQTINLGTTCYGAAPNPPCGLTIAAENPVYLQGNYDATNTAFTGASVATAVAGDTVTLLSNKWNDANSFISPYDPSARSASTTEYRTAIISGKTIPFPQTAGSPQDYGTDGGVHNFLRYLEGWGGSSLYYDGSMVSFYYSRQSVGPYKCCTTVYGPPDRQYAFDTNFTLGPQWLPPNTPVLRSINTIGFTQMLMPTQ
ncbi:MAG TPA: PilX N-terminal domain-containing pilus assembly protein [Candidatus Acidoferrales bacterium]|nr:PilX N-terminal domain-containing pilus assembly protein [Candidatus Acidoferrales bacterium]